MKNYRLFLLGFVSVSFVLLTGFQKPSVKQTPLAEKQAASIDVKKLKFKNKESSKQQETNNKHLAATTTNNGATEDAELQKTLDLSIPFKASDNTWLKTEQNSAAQIASPTMFTNEKKKPRRVSLDSEMLMSQEPEADKQKSLDGAGIVITLKR